MASAADVIARRLYEAGCRHAFGIPGGEVLRLVKGLTENGISFGLAKHENAAGFMAEGTYQASGAPPAGADLERARDWLREAARPLVIAGVEVLDHGAEAAVAGLAEHHGIPLLTTYKAKGVLPEDHGLSLGAAGLSPKADALLLGLIGSSDLIILAGYDPIEMRSDWRNPWPAGTRVAELSAVANTHYMHQAGVSFIGDVGAGLDALSDNVPDGAKWPAGEAAATRAALHRAFAAEEDWGPGAVIEVARRVLPRDTVATVDTGAHRILLSQMWQCYRPRTLLQSTGLCTMGCALPLAMGYKLVAPERTVVAFVGDAGLEMVLGELATLRNLGLPLIVVVFVDESLALIELKQRDVGYANVGVDFGALDFPAVARAFDMHGVWADDRDGLEGTLSETLERQGPTLIACRIGARAYDGRI